MEKLYHINSRKGISKAWQPGDTIALNGYNNYINNIIDCCLYVRNDPQPEMAINHVLGLKSDNEKVLNAKNISIQQRDRNLGHLRREFVFERVRRNNYPLLPSRMTSTYLVESIEEAKAWSSILNTESNDFSILEVEALPETKIFHTYAGHIDNWENALKDLEIEANAHAYWRGTKLGHAEILASGPLLVINHIS
ncbi:DUF2441 domain-containing protein [Serratia marcescens]|nr:DUF2441 domain-containing protein [Serratia marcescens]MBH2862622.1 DUF2441 domain-containing protein [Serratia marcescens]